jgi:hypothetical protein
MATIKKAQVGRTVSKILSKKSSGLINDVVRKPAGMTNKPFKFTPVVLTDAQKASNAEILKNPGKATAKSWTNAKKIASKESSQDAKNMATGKTRNQVSLEQSNAPFLKNLNETSTSALAKRAQNIKKSAAPRRKNGGSIAKDGKWMQKVSASIKRRGTAGKCTPITKPGCTGRAKTLAKTFKKIAKSNKKK